MVEADDCRRLRAHQRVARARTRTRRDVPVAKLFEAWADARIRRRWLPDEGVRVRTATAPKSIRLGWSDGTIIAAGFTAKGDARSAVALSHGKWPDRDSVTRVKTMWAERLAALERVLDAE